MDVDHLTRRSTETSLYRDHAKELVRFATALVGPFDAHDAVSDGMLSLLRDGRLGEADHPKALMYRAVFAKARSMQRTSFRRRAREQRTAERLASYEPEVHPEVFAAVVQLSARQRACIYLTYWEDLTVGEIAGRLDIGEGTVKRYLARARGQLRRVLHE